MMWTVQHDVYDDMVDLEYDAMDPAADSSLLRSAERGRLSQDEEIKAYEATLANEARRTAEIEREQQEQEQLQQLVILERQAILEHERIQQLAQLELAQLEEERWRRLQILHQQQLQYQAPPVPKRKEVGFADSALLYSSDRTYDEVNRMWYLKEELATFKNERKLVVKALKKANFDVANVERSGKYCLRGYEAYFSLDVNKAMKDARSLATSLVLTEQQRQRSLGVHDEEAIRIACSAVSQWAGDIASKLGENDEVDVYGVYDNSYSMDYFNFDDQRYDNGQYYDASNMDYAIEHVDSSQQQRIEDDSVEDNLAERLESAMKLVQALRSGAISS
jgi:hypothetical protein